jgi:predicted DNA binding CopG/RHH family protein
LNEESVDTEMAETTSPDVKNKAGAEGFSYQVCVAN